MGRKLLSAAALACALIAPALAYSQSQASFKAYDNGWTGTPGGGTTLTLTTPATVEFSYPAPDESAHTVNWTSANKPTCQNVPSGTSYVDGLPGWKGTCTFSRAGTYTFVCGIHPSMTGTVKIEDPAPSVTPTPTATATPADPDTPTATPTPVPGAQPTPQPARQPFTAKLAATQKGATIRGTTTATDELTVTVTYKQARIARRTFSTGKRFAVTLNAAGRRALNRHKTLRVTVTLACGSDKRTFRVNLRK